MESKNIVLITYGNVKVVRYNKPKKRNALDINMYMTVSRILEEAARDDDISVVVLTGTGGIYSSGNDITAPRKSEGAYDLFSALNDFIRSFINFPKILIAMVNGPAIGIAATTLPLCDLVYASENSYFYTPFTKLGIVPEGCSTFTFPRIMGERKAVEMLMFNYKMPAEEALKCGLINGVFKEEELQQKVWDRIKNVTNLRFESLIESKKLLRGPIRDKLLEINDIELRSVKYLVNRSKI
ncbi:unnamed protein product [Chilo suppressalis]|uniref:Enoyl-CoA delta isomerase 2, mitochondrial n=1 Tax=Chilo suppressalis TaxID=168631 RepID=A0ABN8B0D7_CHISP|nr:hypothetical protein evm_007655 [Chilo suppressalis]CAH0398769.1 unnamed protein product [Chilo suppressalis]